MSTPTMRTISSTISALPCTSVRQDGIAIFITGLSVPRAFGSEATVFAVSYAVVRFLHLALYADASRRGNASWSAIAGFASGRAAAARLTALRN